MSTDRFFANPTALPSMPEVARRLLQSFDDDRLGMNELAETIAQDQGLSTKLLRLANSAHYSPPRSVGSLRDAAQMIGLTGLRDLALAGCLAGAFPVRKGFDRLRFWRRCVATAGHARLLAGACEVDPEAAYLGGLIMHTGELLMLMTEPDAVVLAEARARVPDSLLDQQRRLMQCTHLEVTAELARRWKFPQPLVVGLLAAGDPLVARPFSRLGAVLRLASLMAEIGDRGLPLLATLTESQPELIRHIQLDLDWLVLRMAPWDALTSGVEMLLH